MDKLENHRLMEAGRLAALQGKTMKANPHRDNDDEKAARWDAGFRDGEREHQKLNPAAAPVPSAKPSATPSIDPEVDPVGQEDGTDAAAPDSTDATKRAD